MIQDFMHVCGRERDPRIATQMIDSPDLTIRQFSKKYFKIKTIESDAENSYKFVNNYLQTEAGALHDFLSRSESLGFCCRWSFRVDFGSLRVAVVKIEQTIVQFPC